MNPVAEAQVIADRAGAAGDGDVRAGDVHARPGDVAAIDRVAQRDIVERAVRAEVAHGRKSRHERGLDARYGREHDLRRGVKEHGARIAVVLGEHAVRLVSVTVDKSRNDGHVREVDDLRSGRDAHGRSDILDLPVANENDLIREDNALVGVDEFPGLHDRHLGVGDGRERECQREGGERAKARWHAMLRMVDACFDVRGGRGGSGIFARPAITNVARRKPERKVTRHRTGCMESALAAGQLVL